MSRKKNELGRSLMKNRPNKNSDGFTSAYHTTEMGDGYEWGRLNLKSVTEQSTLDDFLQTAELAGTDFTAEKLNIKFVKPSSKVEILNDEDRLAIKRAQDENKNFLSVPRRPQWNEFTTPDELLHMESESFLEWRRKLSELESVENITITPYEKNLEFWRQLWRVIERSDVVVQIVDSRNPLMFRCEDLEKYVKEVGSHKVNVILVNKSDLLTEKQRKAWHSYFESVGATAIFFSALEELNKDDDDEGDQSYVRDVKSLKISVQNDGSGKLFDKTALIEFFKSIRLQKRYKENVTTVGLVGYPNVGKSSTINAMLREKKVSVSATPGKTKHFQTIFVDEELCLCDCPGLVMPTFVSSKAEMILNGILPIDQMRDHFPPINTVCLSIPRHVLEDTYSITLPLPQEGEDSERPPYADELLNTYGYMRGYMTQRGLPDTSRSARRILKDFVNGKLLHCLAPPDIDQESYHPFPARKTSTNQKSFNAHNAKMERGVSASIDSEFFKTVHSPAHYRGQSKIAGYGSIESSTQEDKPSKRHNNRRKKEKLRRVYGHLDAS